LLARGFPSATLQDPSPVASHPYTKIVLPMATQAKLDAQQLRIVSET
jgi:hypothetical protein